METRSRAARLSRLGLAAMVIGGVIVTAAPAAHAAINGPQNIRNSAIADHAERFADGSTGGQCLVFVTNRIKDAGGPMWYFGLDTSTYQNQWSQRASEIPSLADALRGDIIQWGGGAGGTLLHTAIVTRAGGDPQIIDSNWGYPAEQVNRGSFSSRNLSGSRYRIWRVGLVDPPTAPTSLSSSVSGSSVTVRWADTSGETGFQVYRWNGAEWRSIGTTGANVTSYTDGGLGSGTWYHTVCATNPVGGNCAGSYTTSQVSGISASAWYSVVNQRSGKCVDVRGAGTAYGTAIQQYSCNNTYAQHFQFQPTDSGYYRVIYRKATGEVWDVNGVSTADGAKLHVWGWNGGRNQQWKPVHLGNGYYRFEARHSGKCLDVPGASTADSVQLQQYTCNGTGAQAFSLSQR